MNSVNSKFGFVSVVSQCFAFSLYGLLRILSVAGVVQVPYGTRSLWLARASFALLPLSLLFAITGVAFDKNKVMAALGLLSVLLVFIAMVMIAGYW